MLLRMHNSPFISDIIDLSFSAIISPLFKKSADFKTINLEELLSSPSQDFNRVYIGRGKCGMCSPDLDLKSFR